MSFDYLGLSDEVLAAVKEAGYTEPTPIQKKTIPSTLQGRDILGIAQTGTGKTAAFTLPMIDILSHGRARARMPRSLILEPTRELAAQVQESFEKYGKQSKLTCALLIGGTDFKGQVQKLDRGVDVLVATPGRLIDHMERGNVMLTGVELLVVDEADRMLDMGFIPDIERICKMLPKKIQSLFFSATMPKEVKKLTDSFLKNPKEFEISAPSATATTIEQKLVKFRGDDKLKRKILRHLLDSNDIKNAIIFCNRKKEVKIVNKSLGVHKYSVAELHGDLHQDTRTEVLSKFKSGETQILVASDVAARGLDIPNVGHIFNYDVPHNPEDYIHRIGRTGRAGKSGKAFTLCSQFDKKYLDGLLKFLDKDIPILKIPDDVLGEAPKKNQKRHEKPEKEKPSEIKVANSESNKSHNRKPIVGLGDHVPDFLRR